jgi:hypothetical protein
MLDPSTTSPFTDIYPPVPDTPAETQNVRATPPETEAHPEAVAGSADRSARRTVPRTVSRTASRTRRIPIRWLPSSEARLGPAAVPLGANRVFVLALVRHRLLSYEQIARLSFPGQAHQVIGRRVRRIASAGWLEKWDQPVVSGGQPRFVLPTAKAQRWAFHQFHADTHGTACAPLVRTMLPARPPSPLVLAPGVTPAFLQHQKETNDLAIAVAMFSGLPVLWSSTWERPLPVQAGGITLPQPDAVFLLGDPEHPRLVFLEHDRGMEPLAHFRATKTARYADLAARPELCERLFGVRDFEVWVSVLDARERRPLARLEALLKTAMTERMTDTMRFTLGGWLFAYAGGPVFFPRGVAPASDAVAASAHPLEPITAGWDFPTHASVDSA